MRILVDMDGVLADFERGFEEAWRAAYPDLPVILAAQRRRPLVQDEYPPELRNHVHAIFHAPGFFRALPPVPGGRAALEGLRALGCDVRLCTTPLLDYRHCVVEKYEWVERELGPAWLDRLMLTRDKTIIRADVLVDDRPQLDGADVPTWEHVLYDQPYNRADRSKRRLTWQTWRAVLFPDGA